MLNDTFSANTTIDIGTCNADTHAAHSHPIPTPERLVLEVFLEHKCSLFDFARAIGYTINQFLAW